MGPIDTLVTGGGRTLDLQAGQASTVSVYRIGDDGALSLVQTVAERGVHQEEIAAS